MKDEGKNFLLFAVVAALILFGWQMIGAKFFPTANPPATKIVDGKSKPLDSSPGPAGPAATSPDTLRDREKVIAETPRVRIETPRLAGSINLKGARIDDLVLSKYKETVAKDSKSIRLFSPSGSQHAYFASFGWSGDGVTTPNADTVFTPSAPVLTPANPVTLAWTNPQGMRFAIRVAIDERYMFAIRQTVTNPGAKPVTIRPYALISRTGVSPDPDTWTDHVGPIGVFDHGATYDITFGNLQGKEATFFGKTFGNIGKPGDNYFDSRGGWFGFGDKYWLAALIPDSGAKIHGGFRAAVGDTFQADFALTPQVVAPGKALVSSAKLFAGAKETNTLDFYEDKLGVHLFGKAVDWGWFEVVEKPIFKYLDFLFRVIGNFGLAIIALTLTIRGLLFPIAQRQFASMAKMRAIQPKMKALQERYKDDKARAQQEVMALYKAEGVNPLAGCLPTFLQIPILYALYKVLLLSIEMRHQPFVGWIQDLSAPDPANLIALLSLAGITAPVFLHQVLVIAVVPFLLGVSMYFQFKLNPQPMDEAQAQVFKFMPWILMFVMAGFPVGLQIYWITSNCLTMLQQRLLYARHPELKVPATK